MHINPFPLPDHTNDISETITDSHDITEILLDVALNTINQPNYYVIHTYIDIMLVN